MNVSFYYLKTGPVSDSNKTSLQPVSKMWNRKWEFFLRRLVLWWEERGEAKVTVSRPVPQVKRKWRPKHTPFK